MKIVLSIVVFILLGYILFIKKEIKNIYTQLNDYNNMKTRKKIDVDLIDKDIEQLATSINNHIDIHIRSSINQKNSEEELKRAIANVSHDIRTPLTSILGYIQMSKNDNISQEQKEECINIAEARSKSLKNILENFFSLSIIQLPEYVMKMESVNVNSVLYEVISSSYDEFLKHNIEPVIDIKEENIIVIGNKIEINRIIDNIISNLIKYSKGNELIELKQEDKKCILTISNRTKDLKQEDINLFFNRFYKYDLSRNSSESSGLGLSITKSLIEKMNGDIEVKLEDDIVYLICSWNVI
ncbi:MAG: HAMP domain-containing sensor histidine kinase [Romboutsia sp.]